ncbi:hypothetical protein HPB52_022363 [Rhipicephalus sanguineus]|uniref:Uncharacterized protein n=1 Tax=Rhipicephalus sanguineus TaxID=34632 RepID=A0A9D4T4I2_RHISA|nr:hypothetical protein HPB52_022363 [Rhipicephalus sanguineus]
MQHGVVWTVQVSGGYVQYRFDCGSGEGLVRVAGRRVDDGVWHALRLERRGGSAQLAVDAQYKASGSAPGPHDVLNLEGRELHLGGAPAVAGLVGCLDNAQVGSLPLPLHLRPAGHAQLRRLANVHFSCHLVDACGSQPCLNGATCRPLLTTGYSCTCPAHFQGPQCEEPVAEGQCTDGMSNLEQRPASYTTREATLNNFDTVRSYGSAADDLESRYQPNDLRCHTPSGSAPTKGLYLDKIPNDLKAALSPPLAPQSSATSIASDLPGGQWNS